MRKITFSKTMFFALAFLTLLQWTALFAEKTTLKPNSKTDSNDILTFKEMGGGLGIGKKIDSAPDRRSIVDINGQIIISVNKQKVQEQASKWVGDIPPETLKNLYQIQKILEFQANILEILTKKDFSSLEDRRKNLEEFSSAMLRLNQFLMEDQEYRKLLNEALKDKSGKEYRKVFALARSRMEVLKVQLDSALIGVLFRMGGWLVSGSGEHPVHIEGFDSYEKGQFYEYPFLTIPATDEIMQQIKDLRDAADRFNKGGPTALFSIKENLQRLKDEMIYEKDKIMKSVEEAVAEIKGAIKEDFEKLSIPKTREFLVKLEKIKSSVRSIQDSIEKLNTSADQYPLYTEILVNINDFLKAVSDMVNKDLIKTNFQDIIEEIKRNLKDLSEEARKSIESKWETVKNTFLTDLKNWADGIVAHLSDLIPPFIESTHMLDEQSRAALALGEKVSRLLLDQIPEQGVLDLRYAGVRQEGDEIYIKAVLEKKIDPGSSLTPPTMILADKTLVLYPMLSIRMKPGLIFAAPPKNDQAIDIVKFKQTFQAAPSYSALLKIGNRSSVFYNRYIQLGIGFNVAALDFDMDSNLELGLGAVISIFKDFLQVGVGRNMQHDVWYWFFGIQLPWGNLALPASAGAAQTK
jgi:hypothetical protein